jgi:hypothetical protein
MYITNSLSYNRILSKQRKKEQTKRGIKNIRIGKIEA